MVTVRTVQVQRKKFEMTLRKTPLIDRFNLKWEEDDKGCHIWTGAQKGKGTFTNYGAFMVGSTLVYAHRWIYAFYHGPIPTGMVVRHKCDTPLCVNITHLEIGTNKDNSRDMSLRGRARNKYTGTIASAM